MKLNATVFGAAAIATVAAATVSTAPVQAAAIAPNSAINLAAPNITGGGVDVTPTGLDFYGSSVTIFGTTIKTGQGIGVTGGNGSFSNPQFLSPLATVKDLTLSFSGNIGTLTGSVTDFITGVNFLTPSFSVAPLSLDLQTFVFNSTTGIASFTGLFRSGTDSIAATGEFTTQRINGATSYSLTAIAVPTPALLPGLVALGVGVLRKRKNQQVEA